MSDTQGIGEDLFIKRRYLPHWQAGGSTYFITWRLECDRELTGGDLLPHERAIVKRAILFWHRRKWQLHICTVMPDHVHIIATPLQVTQKTWYPISEILHSIKRFTAREINQKRRREGTFWQHESYDRLIRNAKEFDQKVDYIVNNALTKGLVIDPYMYDGLWCEFMESEEWRKFLTCGACEAGEGK